MDEFAKTSFVLNDKEIVSVIDELSLWSAPFGLKLLEAINLKKNISAIDIGFGLGFPLLEVAMRLGNSCKVFGIDPWKAATERAKTKAKIYEVTNVEFLSGVAEQIPLPDKSIDLIFSNNGINNVEDIIKTFEECSRIAKPGAQFVFTFNTDKTMVEFYDVFENVLQEKGMLNEVGNLKEHIYQKRKPVVEVKNLVEKNDFKIKRIVEDKFSFNFIDGTAMLNHFLIRLAFLESWKNLVTAIRRKEIFNEVENKLNESAIKNGSFTLTVPFVLFNCEKN